MHVKRLDHVVLTVRDIDTTARFYTRVLGLVEERRMDVIGLIQLRAGQIVDRKSREVDELPAAGAPCVVERGHAAQRRAH